MEKEFVPYELAVKLKAIGFDEPCFAKYTFIPEDEIDWFTIPEQGITNKTSFGSSKNYNSKSFEKEGTISAPTFSQAFRWFREKHQKNNILFSDGYQWTFDLRWADEDSLDKYPSVQFPRREVGREMFDTYEEAELACLAKLIEIAENE
jgi:hypothetical protein